ncbi:MAG: conjugal transfer protein TraI [Proteobacteria bacterium]|nr:MAG: conjugal transfer protein TraI [Pseudomonadota bacterium]
MSEFKSERELAEALRLRPERPAVTRVSRRVLIGLGAIAGAIISGALLWGLAGGQSRTATGSELYNTDNKPAPEGLAMLPRDYTVPLRMAPPPTAPVLGPPLPGDLGRPIRNANLPAGGEIDPEQRISQESEAARVSRLFAASVHERSPGSHGSIVPNVIDQGSSLQSPTTPSDFEDAQNNQDRKLAFLTAPSDRRTVSRDRLADPASRYIVQAGAVIPAALITGIRSDLPGQVTAQVTEHVYDSPTGRHLLIPQGSKLIGTYDSQVSHGQDRVLLVWTRLILPNGRSILLERQSGADTQGFAGLEDEVDHHWGRIVSAAALSTLLGIGAQLGASANDSAILTALRRGSADSLSQTGQLLVRRDLNVQPTLTIRPGYPVRVIVNRDLVLIPYRA